MISKREWYAALRRMLKRAALLATLSAVLTGYGMA